MILKKKFRREK